MLKKKQMPSHERSEREKTDEQASDAKGRSVTVSYATALWQTV